MKGHLLYSMLHVTARIYVRAKAKRNKTLKCEAFAKKEQNLFSRFS